MMLSVIIAGSRSITEMSHVELAMERAGIGKYNVIEIVSGCARGVDTLGEQWASERGLPVKRFPADWEKHGKSAGPIRNSEMAKYAHALVAIKHPDSRGTEDMIRKMRKAGKLVWIYTLLEDGTFTFLAAH